jgi:hypothetical protein
MKIIILATVMIALISGCGPMPTPPPQKNPPNVMSQFKYYVDVEKQYSGQYTVTEIVTPKGKHCVLAQSSTENTAPISISCVP